MADKRPSVVEMIRLVLQDDKERKDTGDIILDLAGKSVSWILLFVFLGFSALIGLVSFIGFAEGRSDSFLGIMIALICFFAGMSALDFLWKQRAELLARQASERMRQHELDLIYAAHRPDLVKTAGDIEVAIATARGKLSEADRLEMEYAEARRQRDHELLMAEMGNTATIEQIREKLKAEIEMLDKKLTHEKAPVDVEVAERKVRRQSIYDTLGEIFEIKQRDEALGDKLFEMWQRGAL